MTPTELDEARRAYLASGGTVHSVHPHVEPLRIGTKFNPAIAERRTHIEARIREEYPSCASVAKTGTLRSVWVKWRLLPQLTNLEYQNVNEQFQTNVQQWSEARYPTRTAPRVAQALKAVSEVVTGRRDNSRNDLDNSKTRSVTLRCVVNVAYMTACRSRRQLQ